MAVTLTYGIIDCSCPADTNEAALYLVPASTELHGVLRITNLDSSSRTYRVAHCKATGVATNDEWIAYDRDISGNETHEYSITAGAAEEIRIKSGLANVVTFHLSGKLKVTS